MQSQCESLLVAGSPDPRRPFRSDPIFLASPLPTPTLPSSNGTIKASEKISIPDTNTIVCTFLLDGVSL